MTSATPITVAYGDGIGPEIMDAVLDVLRSAGAKLNIQTIEIGERLYKQGFTSGISQSAWKTILENKIFLKAPITTPQGGGYKSLNVTIRTALSLYANIRPSKALSPYVKTNHPKMDIVIVRENEEDLYSGIEYRQTHNMYSSIKLISRTGCENIIKFAFEYAVNNNRKKVTCMSKDNIMKFTDGLFHKVFDEIAATYPQIENEHYIIDIGAARLANSPERFDVIVTSNLYGDIISDITAEVSGSVGMAGSANIGAEHALFEAIHGSAPDISGQNIANPSGLLNAAIMMLVHIGQGNVAAAIENAWLRTIEDGIHTKDIFQKGMSVKEVSTKEFANAIKERLGQKPQKFKQVSYLSGKPVKHSHKATYIEVKEQKKLVGVDVYINLLSNSAADIAEEVNKIADGELQLQLISSMGLKLWPQEIEKSSNVNYDYWRLRFVPNNSAKTTSHADIIYLLKKFNEVNFDVVKTENLYTFEDKLGFSLAQGQ